MRKIGVIVLAVECVMVCGCMVGGCAPAKPKAPVLHVQGGNTTVVSEKVVTSSSDELTVSPTYELPSLIQGYEIQINRDAARELELADIKAQWLERKKGGYTRWGSKDWMKEPSYYRNLNTFELVDECFSRPTFLFEMSIYDDPIVGFESLRMFHNGYAELFGREDMWNGILHVYDTLSSKLDPNADITQIVITAGHLDQLGKLYGLSPLREQVRGKKKLFLAANLRVLKKFKWYLENYDPKKLGTNGSPGFFREPCSVAQVALMLAKQVDPQRYAMIEPAITSIRWTKEQRVQDLSSFIDLVLASVDGIVPYEYCTTSVGINDM